jgi:chromosome partitioning protein
LLGRPVLLIDADAQSSALDWQASREGDNLFPVVGMARPTLHKDLPELANHYDHIVIDGSPRINDLAKSAIMASDLVLIPLQPSPYDVWAAHETVSLVSESTLYKPSLRALFVLNRVVTNTAIGRDVIEAMKDYPYPIARTHIHQRVVFAESAARGVSVLEQAPQSPASREIRHLTNEILEY